MLKLTGIKKTYVTGDTKVEALRGVSIEFRNSEFVSVLGHSGCGKTTLLNVIGGLDRYDEGDLEIKGISTKKYKDSDWDTYRNHSVGFVFQSYNLIPHQTVLSNVELALTLSGVSKAERKKRAKEVLEKVGLGDQLNKKPNQMSGGQMQRVAIARALVNDPEILLADEPTGALDSETSVQIMDLLKEIAADRLVIMVTHNPEIAEQYSTRIVRLVDGRIVSDSDPYDSSAQVKETAEEPEGKKEKKKKGEKTSMSFFTALSLSLNNLFTKKMRTALTSFAGSIGIIGIALILALSNGVELYIQSIQREALSSYPMTIESTGMDMNDALSSFTGGKRKNGEELIQHDLDKVYSNTAMAEMTKIFTAGLKENNLTALKKFLESEESGVAQYVSDIQYTYSSPMNIYSADTENGPNIVNPSPMISMMQNMFGITGDESPILSSLTSSASYESMLSYYDMWKEMIDNEELLHSQYDLLAGKWPQNYDEVVLVVDPNNEVTELTLQALGISDPSAMIDMYMAMQNGETYEPESVALEYDEVLNLRFRIVLAPDYYEWDEEEQAYVDKSEDAEYVTKLVENGTEIKVVGILRPAEGSVSTMIGGSIGYLSSLPEHVIEQTRQCELVKKQMADPETDVFTGLPFPEEAEETEEPAKAEDKKESTTAAPAKEETTAKSTDVFETPKVTSLENAGGLAPQAMFTAMSESEIYAYIDENFKGEDHDLMYETVTLMMKSSLSSSERKTLIADLDKLLAGQEIPGYGTVTGEQAYGYLRMMSKQQKLSMLEQIIKSGYVPTNEDVPEEEEKPEETAEPEPEPEPLAKSYKEALSLLGVADIEMPLAINIYPTDFEAKDEITRIIDEYNQKAQDEGREKDVVVYTDYIGLILSSVTKIVKIVSYVLICFVAISLIVSSIMIGIITYISVLERTKEIGILRSIGASKHDVSMVFNAESVTIGFVSGVIGIGITILCIIPINLLLKYLTTLGAAANLPVNAAVVLIIISVFLSFIAGLIPSKMAARKDPVEALRTE
ncbi:MAG: ABC transporter ATP-binding protein/permease [Clostridia bacterium]|nr:ABC transporter ATP-binding protein/permease [Clostridia bacterium]